MFFGFRFGVGIRSGFDEGEAFGEFSGLEGGFRPEALGGVVLAVGEEDFVEFEAVFAHGDLDGVETGGGDVEGEDAGDAGVFFGGALGGAPVPVAFGDGLPAGGGFGPGVVDAEVEAVVFGVGGVGAGPEPVFAGGVEVDFVGEDGEFAGFGGEVFADDEFFAVVAAGVGEDFEVGATGGSADVVGVAIGGGFGGVLFGGEVPGAGVGDGLGVEVFSFDGDEAVFFFENGVAVDEGGGGFGGEGGEGGEQECGVLDGFHR